MACLLSTPLAKRAEKDVSDPLSGYEVFGGFGVPIRPNATLPGYTPGAVPLRLPKGVGIKLPAGADILMQTHYAPWPVRDSDQSSVNLFFADEPVGAIFKTRMMMPFDLVEEDTMQPPDLSLSERFEVALELIDEFGQGQSGNGTIGGDIVEAPRRGLRRQARRLVTLQNTPRQSLSLPRHLERRGRHQPHQHLSARSFAM